jgi:hypothetical protein
MLTPPSSGSPRPKSQPEGEISLGLSSIRLGAGAPGARSFLDPRNARAVSIADVAERHRTQGVRALDNTVRLSPIQRRLPRMGLALSGPTFLRWTCLKRPAFCRTLNVAIVRIPSAAPPERSSVAFEVLRGMSTRSSDAIAASLIGDHLFDAHDGL